MAVRFKCRSARSNSLLSLLVFILLAPISYARVQVRQADPNDPLSCDKSKPCALGCCGPLDEKGIGVCGMGPKFCGDGCTSTCTSKSECDPGWGIQWSNASKCPLNVCCSDYGFCGTDDSFCKGVKVLSPTCDTAAGSSNKRTIGYYEGWNHQRPCGNMKPEGIPVGYYTHINFAFSLIDPKSYRLTPMDPITGSLYNSVSALKDRDPNLRVWIAVGGWAMNDPGPYRTVFSDLARSQSAQDEFFESVVTFLERNGFDGIDIDWEYPVEDDRGGVPEDFVNYVTLLQRLRNRLNQMNRQIGISITLPASYWYLKGFDISSLEPHIDWFNIMTYDIHGVWDSTVKSIGSVARAHTNLTEIQQALELLWRNNINPERVVMGLGFYGRSRFHVASASHFSSGFRYLSFGTLLTDPFFCQNPGFTMEDPACMTANCPFRNSTGARPGACTNTSGVLSAAEINKIIANGAKVTLDPVAAVNIVTWDTDQWVSWDDTETLKTKVEFANSHCLGGTMIWAVDLDDGTLIKALGKNLGRAPKPDRGPNLPYMPCFGTGGWPSGNHHDVEF
ncbi:hypothetical protein AAE478_007977 [Parahypoxylon ruwenzoriense]